MSSIKELPNERVYQILLPLSQAEIISFCRTNQQFADICRDQYFWRLKYFQDYGKADFITLAQEFPELLPGNWMRAYYCRTLTRQYGRLQFGYYNDLESVRHDLETGVITQADLPYSILESLGLWSREQAFHDLWNTRIGNVDWSHPPPKYPTYDMARQSINRALDNIIQRHDENASFDPNQIGTLSQGINFEYVTPTTHLVASTPSETDIPQDRIVTPRIITIVMDPYAKIIKRIATEEHGLPADQYPSFEYTYTTTENGFTLRELIDKIGESLSKYVYITCLIYQKFSCSINNFQVNGVQYQDGKYYVECNYLSI